MLLRHLTGRSMGAMKPENLSPTVGKNADIDARLEQIAKIAQNARTSWFALLALLVFVGFTLMGHEDGDFFAFGAETELPLVSISVPTVSFFYLAPMLTAALYVYLHIYLQSLWFGLAKCPAKIGNDTLEERVYPMMLCTLALAIRRQLNCEADKPVEGSKTTTIVISVLMVWFLGPIVLAALWWRSMPFHDEWLTLLAAVWLWVALIAGGGSLFQMFYLMRFGELYPYEFYQRPLARPGPIISLELLVFLVMMSWDTTEGGRFVALAKANLVEAELSHKPADWLHYDVWLEDWKYRFRQREDLDPAISEWPHDKHDQFRRESRLRWAMLTRSLDSPNLQSADLRGAALFRAFLSGANLSEARFGDSADLTGAWLEGTNLIRAQFGNEVSLRWAWLQGADLMFARFGDGADIVGAEFGDGANLANAEFGNSADFRSVRLGVNADFTDAQFGDAANLFRAQFGNDADLVGVEFGDGANLAETRFGDSADLRFTQFGNNANFNTAHFGEGANLFKAQFGNDTDLTNVRFGDGVNLAEAELKDRARLTGALFGEGANLVQIRFGDEADLVGLQFGNNANLAEIKFGDDANLRFVRFGHNTSLVLAQFGDNADLVGVAFGDDAGLHYARFEGANLSGAQFGDDAGLHFARFGGANLSGVWFGDNADLRFTRFEGANLSGARFEGANLSGARFEGANLSGTRFEGANLYRAEGLTQPQLDTACGDQYTRLPEGYEFTIPSCPQ